MLQTVLTSALFLSMPGVLTKTPPSKSPLGVPGRNALVSVIVVSPSITRASPGLASCSRVSVGVPLQASQNKAKAAASRIRGVVATCFGIDVAMPPWIEIPSCLHRDLTIKKSFFLAVV